MSPLFVFLEFYFGLAVAWPRGLVVWTGVDAIRCASGTCLLAWFHLKIMQLLRSKTAL